MHRRIQSLQILWVETRAESPNLELAPKHKISRHELETCAPAIAWQVAAAAAVLEN